MGSESATQETRYAAETLRHPKRKDEIVAALRNDVHAAEWILQALFRQWLEAILWTLGEQYLEWNWRTSRFQQRPNTDNIPRSVTNLILPKVEIGIHLMMESLANERITSTTKSDKDRAAAEVARGVLRYRNDEGHIEEKKREAASWAVTTGTAFFMAIEDEANKERIRVPQFERGVEVIKDPETGMPIAGPDGAPMMRITERPVMDPETGEQAHQEYLMSDEGVEVCSPFEIVPDMSARYPWEMRRYTHFRARSRDWVGDVYGSNAREQVKAQRETGILGDYQLRLLDIQSRSTNAGRLGFPVGGTEVAAYRYMDDTATVFTRYELPSSKYPKGRKLVMASDVVLEDDDYPYGDDLNLHAIRWSVLPGSVPWGFGMPRNLIPIQRRMNGLDSLDDLIRKTTGNPAWLAPKRSQFNPSLTSARPGAVYTYRPVGGAPRPERLDPKNPPMYNQYQRAEMKADMHEVSGIKIIMGGDAPAGVTAGVSFDILQEQASARFVPQTKENRKAWARCTMQRIEIAQNSNAWKRGRAIPIVGDDGERDVKQFLAADFTGSMTCDVEPVPMTAFSQVAKKAALIEGAKIGIVDLVNSTKNRERARNLFGLGEFDEPFSADYKMAQLENDRMDAGIYVEIGPNDDDETHLLGHGNRIKARDFNDLPEEVRAMHLRHFDKHALRLVPNPAAAGNPALERPQPQPLTPDAAGAPPAAGAPNGPSGADAGGGE